MDKLRSVQVMRGLAACAVVVFHATSQAAGTSAFQLGTAGVDLFFVISGFIMGTIAIGQKPAAFLGRRIWRIYPLWWVAAVIGVLRYPPGPVEQIYASLTLWPVWGQFTFPLPLVGWSLCFEMLFYLGLTVALLARPAVPLTALAVAMIAAWFTDSALIRFLGSPLILEFLFGLAITRLPAPSRWAVVLVPSGIVALLFAPTFVFDWHDAITLQSVASLRVLTCGVPCALIFYGLLGLETRFASSRWDFPVFLGDASYSIYLFHIFVVSELSGLLGWAPLAFCAIAAGAVIHVLIEQRIITHRPRFTSSGAKRARLEPEYRSH